MLEGILGLMTSSGLGAITGLIGGIWQKVEQRKLVKEENRHAEEMAQIDIQLQQMENEQAVLMVDKQIEQAQAEGAIAVDIKDADAFVESMKAASKPSGNPWIDGVKTAVRPVLTGVLLYFSWDIYDQLGTIIGGLEKLDPLMAQELYVYVVHSLIFLTVTAVAWWFASRGEKAVAAIKGMIGK